MSIQVLFLLHKIIFTKLFAAPLGQLKIAKSFLRIMPGTPNLVSKANLINSFYSLASRTWWKYYIQQPKVNPTEYHWFFLHFEVKNSHSLGRISQSTVYQLIHVSWGPEFHSLLKYAMRAKPVALLWAKENVYMAFLDAQNLLIYDRKERLCYLKK